MHSLTPANQSYPYSTQIRHRSNDPIIFNDNYIPFIGGQRRQFLLSNTPTYQISNQQQQQQSATESQQSSSTTINTDVPRDVTASTFEQDFYKIQLAAARLVAIQDKAKRKGTLSAEDNKIYADSLIELGQAAQSLAKLQQSGQIQDFSLLFQPITGLMPQKEQQPPLVSASVESSSTTVGEQKGDEATEQQQFTEEDVMPPNPDDPYEDVNDSVAITAPKKDASVAEAKPIGLSIAGEGGVASSKPNAVALSGRNGLAVSAPKATAIAGVSPEEAAAFSISLPSRNHLVIKSRPNQHGISTASNQRIQTPITFDDYDYVDLGSIKPTMARDVILPNDAISRLRPKVPNGKFQFKTGNSGDEFVNNWKTLIAEDYAAAGPSSDEHRIVHPKLRFSLNP